MLLFLYNGNIYKINVNIIFSYLFKILGISIIAVIIPIVSNIFLDHTFISACISSLLFLILYFIISMILEKNVSAFIFNKFRRRFAI